MEAILDRESLLAGLLKCTDRFDNVMEPMGKLLHNDTTDGVVRELCGRFWLHGPPDFRCAVVPVPCAACPSGCCSCGLPRCCEQAPFYQTHIYAEVYRQERERNKRIDNPFCH